ncbi:MAG: polymorphic toxin type 50 domain-containing protein [Candidatus Melainabacteria bacterium]|nr:polymorphic toxin type 50 domain-containing protein [Candidatus Melainabacteria bacterium]
MKKLSLSLRVLFFITLSLGSASYAETAAGRMWRHQPHLPSTSTLKPSHTSPHLDDAIHHTPRPAFHPPTNNPYIAPSSTGSLGGGNPSSRMQSGMFGTGNTPRNRDFSTLNLPGGEQLPNRKLITPSNQNSPVSPVTLPQPQKPKPVAVVPTKKPDVKQQLKSTTALTPPARLAPTKPTVSIVEKKKPTLAQGAGGGQKPPEPPSNKAKRKVTVIGAGPTRIQGVDRVPPQSLNKSSTNARTIYNDRNKLRQTALDIKFIKGKAVLISPQKTTIQGLQTKKIKAYNGKKASNDTIVNLNRDKQGKHQLGHNGYKQAGTKSILTHPNPEYLLKNYAGTGIQMGSIPRGMPNFRERVNFGTVIGEYRDESGNHKAKTIWGIIHYDGKGLAHIIPDLGPNKNGR